MRDRAGAGELLEAAHAVLCEELIHALPPDKSHAALMAANALAIALRQLRNGGEYERKELAALRRLLDRCGTGLPASAAVLADEIVDGNRALCRCIRDGRADSGDLRALVWTHLRDFAASRVAESNPDYFEASAK